MWSLFLKFLFFGSGRRWDSAVHTGMAIVADSWLPTLMTNLWLPRYLPNYPNMNLLIRMNCGLQYRRSACHFWTVNVTVSAVVNWLLVGCIGGSCWSCGNLWWHVRCDIKRQDRTCWDSNRLRPDIDSRKAISDVRDTFCHQQTRSVSGGITKIGLKSVIRSECNCPFYTRIKPHFKSKFPTYSCLF